MSYALSSTLRTVTILLAVTLSNIFCVHARVDTALEKAPEQTEETASLNTELLLELHISMQEHSKDTHGSSNSVFIKDGQLIYRSRSHNGMDPRPDKNETTSLSNEQQEKLIAHIIENKLNRNIRELKKKAELGTSISISLKIRIDDAMTEAEISGAYSDWRKVRQNQPASNLDNIDFYHDIESLLMFLRSGLGFDIIDP